MAFDDDGPKEEISSLAYEIFGEYWSVFIICEDGKIRRTSIPSNLWTYTVYLMRPETDIEPEFWDAGAKRHAAHCLCSYAEGMAGMIDQFFDDVALGQRFLREMEDHAWWERMKEGFLAEQLRREKLWRERYDVWDSDLPPALD